MSTASPIEKVDKDKGEGSTFAQLDTRDVSDNVDTIPRRPVQELGSEEEGRVGGRFAYMRKHLFSKDVDPTIFREALERYGEGTAGIPPEEEKRVVRKIDWLILPCLSVCYAFYYIDKTTLSYAAIFGIKEDLNLYGTRYSWLSSCFYLGWLVWALPNNLLLQKFPVGKWLGFNIFLWGVLLMCQAAVKSFTPLVVLRCISGAVEATADPAFMIITGMFYTRREQPLRIGIWYMANGIGFAVGGLLGYGIGNIHGALASWRYEFLIIGALCACWGIVIFTFLPDSPATTFWLTKEEKLVAIARLRDNQTGIEDKRWKWDQFREAMTDLKSYAYFFFAVCSNIANGGISNFGTLIIQGLKFNTLNTTLLQVPYGVLVCLWIGTAIILNDKGPKNSRTLVMSLYMLPTMAGSLGFLLAPDDAHIGRLWCYYLTGSFQAPYVLMLSVITSSVAGHTKKIMVVAISFIGFCVGNAAGPFFFKQEQAPNYNLGIGAILTCNCLEFATCFLLRYLYILGNRKKERAAAKRKEAGETAISRDQTAFADLTDQQNENFRYVY